ncbi:cyclin B1 interacting protein 1, E3 ubiquitin protein ligase [Homalodisca vitripennis]|nr:cyclin B1 interacting protein 1, E3 ubiquitin protein ligase [Homalodisca vitripennis]
MDGYLTCNFKRCNRPLSTSAWIASCFHIFCDEHSPALETNKRCPLCFSDLGGEHDLIKKHLNPPEEYKASLRRRGFESHRCHQICNATDFGINWYPLPPPDDSGKRNKMVLAGFNPKNILEIGSRAISFWKFQKFQERMILGSTVRNLEGRLAQSETSYEAIIKQLKVYIQKETQRTERLQKEMELYSRRIQDLEEKNKNKNKQIFNLHVQVEELRKQLNLQGVLDNSVRVNNVERNCRPTEGRVARSPNFLDRRGNHEHVDQMFCSQQFPTAPRPVLTFHPSGQLVFKSPNC